VYPQDGIDGDQHTMYDGIHGFGAFAAASPLCFEPREKGVNGSFAGMRVVINGPRNLHPEDRKIVFSKMVEVLRDRPAEVIIGGARGVDTAAFIACAKMKHADNDFWNFKLTVVLPGHLGEAPPEFCDALRASQLIVNGQGRYAVALVELSQDVSHPASYYARNAVMLGRAGWSATCAVLLSFTPNGETSDATMAMLEMARRERVRVVEEPVRIFPEAGPGASGRAPSVADDANVEEDADAPGTR